MKMFSYIYFCYMQITAMLATINVLLLKKVPFSVNYSNSLWKHAITTSDNNTEIKIWSCQDWQCLQTVIFKSNTDTELYFKAEIDPTSSYLVLTETKNRGLFVLQVMQKIEDENNAENGTKSESDVESNGDYAVVRKSAFIKSIAEFALSSPILSFGIFNATVRKYKCAYNDHYLLEELDDYDEDSLNRFCVVINLYLVQPKSVQECHILYQPTVSQYADVGSSMSAISSADDEPDKLLESITKYTSPSSSAVSEVKTTVHTDTHQLLESIMNKSPITNVSDGKSPAQSKPAPLSLMTPDSFQSHGKYYFIIIRCTSIFETKILTYFCLSMSIFLLFS